MSVKTYEMRCNEERNRYSEDDELFVPTLISYGVDVYSPFFSVYKGNLIVESLKGGSHLMILIDYNGIVLVSAFCIIDV